jgi:hypothetical protein
LTGAIYLFVSLTGGNKSLANARLSTISDKATNGPSNPPSRPVASRPQLPSNTNDQSPPANTNPTPPVNTNNPPPPATTNNPPARQPSFARGGGIALQSPLPEIEAEDLNDISIKTTDFLGKHLLIIVWSYQSEASLNMFQYGQNLVAKHRGRIEILGFNTDSDPDVLATGMKTHGVPFRSLRNVTNSGSRISDIVGTTHRPMFIFVDKSGKVNKIFTPTLAQEYRSIDTEVQSIVQAAIRAEKKGGP